MRASSRKTCRDFLFDVMFRSQERRWWKYTKPDHAGLAVTWEGAACPFPHNASPLEYPDRLRAANLLLADDVRLEGLWRNAAGAWRVVTSQEDVPGAPATRDEIIAPLAQTGWGCSHSGTGRDITGHWFFGGKTG